MLQDLCSCCFNSAFKHSSSIARNPDFKHHLHEVAVSAAHMWLWGTMNNEDVHGRKLS